MAAQSYIPVTPNQLDRPTEELAYQLLNWVLVHETPEGLLAGRVVECEMYQGPEDRGAHSFGGRPTARTQVMYGPAGYAYVYLIYGMYYCLNLVTASEGMPHAILIRALEPLEGIKQMMQNRSPAKTASSARITSGPGKLCRALNIDRRYYGHPLWKEPLYLAQTLTPWGAYQIARGPRINIPYAGEASRYPWRFWVYNNPFVSQSSGPLISLEDNGL